MRGCGSHELARSLWKLVIFCSAGAGGRSWRRRRANRRCFTTRLPATVSIATRAIVRCSHQQAANDEGGTSRTKQWLANGAPQLWGSGAKSPNCDLRTSLVYAASSSTGPCGPICSFVRVTFCSTTPVPPQASHRHLARVVFSGARPIRHARSVSDVRARTLSASSPATAPNPARIRWAKLSCVCTCICFLFPPRHLSLHARLVAHFLLVQAHRHSLGGTFIHF